MDVRVDDVLLMKKQHPCGCKEMLVLRVGMDFRLRCKGCGREFMIPRLKIERNIKKIDRRADNVPPAEKGGNAACLKNS